MPPRQLALRSVVPVWVLVFIGTCAVAVFAPPTEWLRWLPMILVAGTLLTFCTQLALVQKEGFVNRVAASLGGAVAILALATAIFALLASSQ